MMLKEVQVIVAKERLERDELQEKIECLQKSLAEKDGSGSIKSTNENAAGRLIYLAIKAHWPSGLDSGWVVRVRRPT